MKVSNILQSIPSTLEHEFFDVLVQSEKVKIERIVSKGHCSPDSTWYDQEDDEWVLLIKGSAVIAFANDKNVSLQAGDHILIPAHTKHKVQWTDPERETVWLAVHY